MLVRNWMCHTPITVSPDTSLQEAVVLLRKHNIHMLPVIEDARLAGVITDLDIKRAAASEIFSLGDPELAKSISRIKVRVLMNNKPISLPEDRTIEEAAAAFFVHNISGAPVVNQTGKVIGVITKNDIFRAVISLTGIKKKGIQFGLTLKDRPGAIKEITDLIRTHGGRIASILSTGKGDEEVCFNVYIRAYGLDLPNRLRVKAALRDKAELLYVVDHEENTREIYSNPRSEKPTAPEGMQ